jgi:N4-gp56 family major capsid protein
MAVDNVYGVTSRATGDSTHGQNTVIHYYDKAGVKAANAIAVYAQFADRRSMPQKMGTTYKVSKWLHIFDREDGVSPDFATKGYLTSRNILDVTNGLVTAALAEGAGAVNKQSIKKVTLSTNFARYGEMIDYSDEVEMFAEDMVQVHYREELGLLANRRSEDLIQLDMLSTTNVMYVGTASSLTTVGDDSTDVPGTLDGLSKVSYDLIRRAVKKLIRNRAQKNTEIVTGSTKVDTRTVNKAYYAIVGPEVKFDLEDAIRATGAAAADNTEFVYIPAYKYASAANLAEGEIGAMNDVRFIESESAVIYAGQGAVTVPLEATDNYAGTLSTTTYGTGALAETGRSDAVTGVWDRVSNAYGVAGLGTDALEYFDVFPILFPTKGSFATVGLKGNGKIKFNSQAPSKIELSNPYGTQGFFSYNMWYAGIILREERLLKILVCASA